MSRSSLRELELPSFSIKFRWFRTTTEAPRRAREIFGGPRTIGTYINTYINTYIHTYIHTARKGWGKGFSYVETVGGALLGAPRQASPTSAFQEIAGACLPACLPACCSCFTLPACLRHSELSFSLYTIGSCTQRNLSKKQRMWK